MEGKTLRYTCYTLVVVALVLWAGKALPAEDPKALLQAQLSAINWEYRYLMERVKVLETAGKQIEAELQRVAREEVRKMGADIKPPPSGKSRD